MQLKNKLGVGSGVGKGQGELLGGVAGWLDVNQKLENGGSG